MVRCAVLVSALLLASVWVLADCQSECPRTRVQIISRNTTLLSPSNINATRFYSSWPPSYFGNFTPAVWCASPQGPNPNVSLTFSQPVLITGFIPGGYSDIDGSNREYVTNFNLRYSQTLDENTFSSPQEFTISTDNLDRLVILEDPFLALRLHIQVNNFVTSSLYEDICMGMAIYGCHHSEATQVQLPSSCPSVIPEATPALQSPQSQVVRDYQALAIALPIALITILITAAIVVVGVALCIRGRVKEKEPRSPVQYTLQQSDSVRVLDNSALYQSTDLEQEDGRETIREVKNVLYEDDSARLEENLEYSVPWSQDQNGSVQMRSNVSYTTSPTTPSLHTDAPHEYSTLSGVYEETH